MSIPRSSLSTALRMFERLASERNARTLLSIQSVQRKRCEEARRRALISEAVTNPCKSSIDADRSRFLASRWYARNIGSRWLSVESACTRVRASIKRSEAALYAGPFICGNKMQIGSASTRGSASICHGDATHRYRLARPWNYPSHARILQRTPVIYRALDAASRR